MPEIYVQNIFKNFQILPDICPKNARILHDNCPKNIFTEFCGAGTCPPTPTPSPKPVHLLHTSYATGAEHDLMAVAGRIVKLALTSLLRTHYHGYGSGLPPQPRPHRANYCRENSYCARRHYYQIESCTLLGAD